jgi:DNA modification methylase
MNRAVIDKEFIENIKSDSDNLLYFLNQQKESNIIFFLNKIGRLESSFDKAPFLSLLDKENDEIRALAVKNLAKLGDISLLDLFFKMAREDPSTKVKREAASAIGRLRNEKAIPSLNLLLSENDPKVVLQAIRGLLVFRKIKEVRETLKGLLNHPNELVREVVSREIKPHRTIAKTHIKHDEFPDFIRNTVVHGDVLEVLKYVPEESVHLTFTSPPYFNARDYSIYQSYDEYLKFLEKVFKEVYRITKEGRFFILNTSPIIIPRVSRKHASKRYPIPYDIHPFLIKMGWEFIDDIVWLKSEASVKNRNAGFLQHRKPLAYKPNTVTEMLMVYRKKTDKLIDWNMKQYSRNIVNKSKVLEEYESTNVWKIDPTFDKVHSAVFPLELCNRVIKFYSFIGDLIFDPLAGSGTLGKAALRLGRNFFLTEKEGKFINRIREEMEKEVNLFNSHVNKPSFIDLNNFILNSTETK